MWLLSCFRESNHPSQTLIPFSAVLTNHQSVLEMPSSWQPNYISQITSQSWKKHQKLGQDLMSLFSVLQNEPLGESWPWSTERQFEKGLWRKRTGRSKQCPDTGQGLRALLWQGASLTPTVGLHLPAPDRDLVQNKEGTEM